MSKVTVATAADGTQTATVVATTLIDDAIAAVTAPIGLISDDGTQFVSKRVAGMASVGFGVAGFLYGERQGHKRSRDGKQPFVGGQV